MTTTNITMERAISAISAASAIWTANIDATEDFIGWMRECHDNPELGEFGASLDLECDVVRAALGGNSVIDQWTHEDKLAWTNIVHIAIGAWLAVHEH